MKKASLALALSLAGLSGMAMANDSYSYTCKHNHEQRKIEVLYLKRESKIPCEVRYIKKDSEETLWTANYTEGYCEEKATEFVKKQEGWGWMCSLDEPVVDDSLPEDKEKAADKKS